MPLWFISLPGDTVNCKPKMLIGSVLWLLIWALYCERCLRCWGKPIVCAAARPGLLYERPVIPGSDQCSYRLIIPTRVSFNSRRSISSKQPLAPFSKKTARGKIRIVALGVGCKNVSTTFAQLDEILSILIILNSLDMKIIKLSF